MIGGFDGQMSSLACYWSGSIENTKSGLGEQEVGWISPVACCLLPELEAGKADERDL